MKVGVIGAGVMGSGIAQAFAQTKWPSVVMIGGDGNAMNPMDVIALERMVELTHKMSE